MEIVLIHGVSSLPGEERLKLLIKKMKKEFPRAKIIVPNYLGKYPKLSFLWRQSSLCDYTAFCMTKITSERSGWPRILIGYSFGGVIARLLEERLNFQARAVILVGTPNKGIKLSLWEKVFLKILLSKLSIEEVEENSWFLRKLNEAYQRWSPSARYYLIAGKYDKRVPIESALGIKSYKNIVIDTDHSGLIPRKPTSKPNAIGAIIEILKEEASYSTPSFFISLDKIWIFC